MALYLAGVLMQTGSFRWRRMSTEDGDQDKTLILGISPDDLSAIKGLHKVGRSMTLDMDEFLSDRPIVAGIEWVQKSGIVPVTYERLPHGGSGLVLRF